MDVAIANLPPVIELNTQLKRSLGFTHKFLLINIHDAMKITHGGNRRFAYTDSSYFIRLDQRDIEQTAQSG